MKKFKVVGHGVKPGEGEYDLTLVCHALDEGEARKKFLDLHPTVILDSRGLTVTEEKE